MPLYEYQCKSCHSLTERIQKFSDPPLTICPHCGGELEQLISAPAVQFKGAGWYVTDYAKKSGGDRGKRQRKRCSIYICVRKQVDNRIQIRRHQTRDLNWQGCQVVPKGAYGHAERRCDHYRPSH